MKPNPNIITNERFVLHVYDGDYGLASLDIECLQDLVFAAIAGTPVECELLDNIKSCMLYKAPFMRRTNFPLRSFAEFSTYLMSINYNINKKLSPRDVAETFAIKNFVICNLKPVLDFVMWIDPSNCDGFTTLWYMKALPFPFNYLHIKRRKEQAMAMLEVAYPTETDMDVIKEFITSKATQCLSCLSTRLGTDDYFFGKSPTVLDVVVYSHIAPLMKLPLPSNNISNLMTMWPNLTNLVKRIDAKYLSHLPTEPKYLKSEKKKTSDEDISYMSIFLFSLGATSLILGFAYSKGILSARMT